MESSDVDYRSVPAHNLDDVEQIHEALWPLHSVPSGLLVAAGIYHVWLHARPYQSLCFAYSERSKSRPHPKPPT